MVYGRFPDGYFPGWFFSRKDVSRVVIFPDDWMRRFPERLREYRNLGWHSVLSSPAASIGDELSCSAGVFLVEVRPHYSTSPAIALASGPGAHWVQDCCSCLQMSAWDSTVVPRRRASPSVGCRGSQTSAFLLIFISACSPYSAVDCRWSSFSGCCFPYLEQSASACHVRTLSVCFSGSLEDLSLLAFLPVTYCSARAVTVVIFGHFNRSFYLLTYLHDSGAWTHAARAPVSPIAYNQFCVATVP